VCVYIFPYQYTEFTCGYVYISVYSHRVHVCVYIFRVQVCVGVYFRIDTQSSHVGMYVFPYIRTEFMFVFIYLSTYTQGFHVCGICTRRLILVCKYLRVCTQSLCGCVCGYVHTHRDYMCLCSYICISTQSDMFCLYLRMCTRSLHGCVYME